MIPPRPTLRSLVLSLALGVSALLAHPAFADGPAAGAASTVKPQDATSPSTPATATPAPAAAAPEPTLPPFPTFDRIVYAKLHAGLIISDATDDEGHGGKVQGWGICHCKIDAMWAVLTNHAPFPEFVPRVTAMEVTNHTDHGERALQTIDATIATVKYALDYQWDVRTRLVEFHLVEEVPHDLKAVQGSWQLWPIDHGEATLIGYQSAVDTGKHIPGFVRDYLADRGVKDNMDALRRRAEGLPSNK